MRNPIEKLFDRLNQEFWGGRLPQYRVFESDKYGGHGICRRRQRQIYIQRGLSPYMRRKVLLHEMCHAATNGCHAQAWQSEMLRIADLGAPTKLEVMHYNDPRPPTRQRLS